jgi:hypothetical protein
MEIIAHPKFAITRKNFTLHNILIYRYIDAEKSYINNFVVCFFRLTCGSF